MPKSDRVLLGIDAGGTHTRVLVTDTSGHVLGHFVGGGSNPEHGPHAREKAHAAIRGAVVATGCAMADIDGIVVGQAGLNDPTDQEWAMTHTTLPGLSCPRLHVNDAVVAHVGAMGSQPGIVAISGSGSIVLGITESGSQVRNYDFGHYANSAASHVAGAALERIIERELVDEGDIDLARQVCDHWAAEDVHGLRRMVARDFDRDGVSRVRHLGRMAPLVTAAAAKGSPLASSVCQEAARAIHEGICLAGSTFTSLPIRVALIGSVARSLYMKQAMVGLLGESGGRFAVIEPAFSPATGAILMALEEYGTPVDQGVLGNLRDSPSTKAHIGTT